MNLNSENTPFYLHSSEYTQTAQQAEIGLKKTT